MIIYTLSVRERQRNDKMTLATEQRKTINANTTINWCKQSVNFTELYRLNEEFDPGSG